MSDQHLTADERQDYLSRRRDAGELLGWSDHLMQCAACRAALADSLGNQLAADPAGEAREISYQDLVALLDEATDPVTRRDLAAALRHSASGRAELADLERFRAEMNALPVHDYALEASIPSSGSGAFFRWALPLAAIISIGVGAFWWTITLRQQTDAAVKLTDGGKELQIAADGRALALRDLPAPLQAAIAEALRTRRLQIPAEVAALNRGTGTLAGRRDRVRVLRVLAPVATAVSDGKPRFRWAGLPDASAYRVNVVAENSGALLVSDELPASASEWSPNESLPPGETYEWEVQALREGQVIAKSPAPPQPEARFRVLSPAQRAEVEEQKVAAAGSHLSLGVLEARAGLLDDAAAELRKLAVENPRSEIVRQLLEQLDSRRRQ